MAVIKHKKTGMWEVRTYYKDLTGERKQKTKRGFAKKSEALEWERNFKLKENQSISMRFKSFVDIYLTDLEPRIKRNTFLTKKHIIETKILPYFGKRKLDDIARRLEDGHVQYGWSGNGGYYKVVGVRLLLWYQNPEDVEYLFGLGQTRLIGKRGSEYGGYRWLETHSLTGEPFWLDLTERNIFSKIAFIDYGYFYDLDHKWYYIIPGPFRIKMPLELIDQNVDEKNYEFDFLKKVQDKILSYILGDYRESDPEFTELLDKEEYCAENLLKNISKDGLLSVMEFYHKYRKIYDYFDDWILIKTNEENTEITDIVVKKRGEKHVETCEW